jgi:hypothetical protein
LLARRNLRLVERGCFDDVPDRLGLYQVHPAPEKRPHGKLARFGNAGTASAERLQYGTDNYRAPVKRELGNVFARVGVRCRKTSRQAAIKFLPAVGFDDASKNRTPGGQFRTAPVRDEELSNNRKTPRAADANDRDSGPARRSRKSADGVV